jgi:hypothetical protein
MSAPNSSDNMYLTLLSGAGAVVSLSAIQPLLTFTASIIAIVSGSYSIWLQYKKTKNEKL